MFFNGTSIEIINNRSDRGEIRFALFDFDGTLSLIREGWQGVMIPMMVEILRETPAHETEDELTSVVTDYVDRLTGRQTIYQMIQLVEEVKKRGGEPLEPLHYKRVYHERLLERIKDRIVGLKKGSLPREEMLVPGSINLLIGLRDRGVTLYLASGTDIFYVQDEVRVLGIADYFNGGIYGALDHYEKFSKQMLIDEILRTYHLHGSQLVTFGDGYVEIEDTKKVGGIAVGVATDEVTRCGINTWKRNRLIGAGADLIIPDYREYQQLLTYLFELQT
jgi:phosphoglycolate phosphatase-like HAD superfamily hydrolase